MKYVSARPMHVYAQEFNQDYWSENSSCYPTLLITKNKNGSPTIETVSGTHILVDEEVIIKFPNNQYAVLDKELYTLLYHPLLPYTED